MSAPDPFATYLALIHANPTNIRCGVVFDQYGSVVYKGPCNRSFLEGLQEGLSDNEARVVVDMSVASSQEVDEATSGKWEFRTIAFYFSYFVLWSAIYESGGLGGQDPSVASPDIETWLVIHRGNEPDGH